MNVDWETEFIFHKEESIVLKRDLIVLPPEIIIILFLFFFTSLIIIEYDSLLKFLLMQTILVFI